ncbi:MAG: HU family DNA-binding protein [Burkholderiales bacterium]|jgi:nucleoid DNA-binding protein|nr:HU family DNA-binding protein [Burkholderiales bacterium]
MNKSEVIARVAEKTGVDPKICEKVINALEKVLSDKLASSGGASGALDKVIKVLDLLKR